VSPSWLNLAAFGLYRDLRKLVYSKLDAFDMRLVEAAHLSNKPVTLDRDFAWKCAERGYLSLLQWARAQRCRWNEWVCRAAASKGHLHVLAWARENGCPWDLWTCAAAAENGYLSVLQWLRGQGSVEHERVRVGR
jgi:hypothetical protein